MLEKCAECRQPFSCGSEQPTCWCMEIHLPETVLEELRRKFKGCLCEACLKKKAIDFAGSQ